MNPARLTERHQQKLARIQQINKDLYRAYLIAQQFPGPWPAMRAS
jgi:hypothetical protein